MIQESSNNFYNSHSRNNLEPINLNVSKNEYINRIFNNKQENVQKITEDINRVHHNKLVLRPIEIKDLNKNQINADLNYNTFYKENTFRELNQNSLNFNNLKNSQINYKDNRTIYNNNSSTNLLRNNGQYDNSIIEAKNYFSGKNLVNGDVHNNLNFNNNLKNFNKLLKNEKMKEPAVQNNRNLNATTLDTNSQSPVIEKKMIEKFSKTSNFEFNIIENLDVINLNTDISLIEENLKMNKGEFIKRLKSLYDNFNNSQNIFRNNNNSVLNNKSYYQNTSILDRDKNANITRIETIFENYEVKLEEMIQLNSKKSTRKLGNLKKMLHTASLNMYVVRVYKIKIKRLFRKYLWSIKI